MSARIDLNADLGEGVGSDDEMLDIVSSASIACGGHAGNAATIRKTLLACKARNVRVGAHPGYVDPLRFGRFRVVMPLDQLLGQVRSQMVLIRQIAAEIDIPVSYVKLHGALANQAAEELALSVGLFGTVQATGGSLAALVLDNSAQLRGASAVGMRVIREAYADRAYDAKGLLVDRSRPGAVIEDVDAVTARCLRLAQYGEIETIDGTILRSQARSICVHGDTPGAVAMARAIREAFSSHGIVVSAD